MIGTDSYMAPEACKVNANLDRYGLCQTDVWSLGVTIVELCLLKQNVVKVKWIGEDKEKNLVSLLDRARPYYSPALVDLIPRLLKADPSQRIGIDELVETLEQQLAIRRNLTENEREQRGSVEAFRA